MLEKDAILSKISIIKNCLKTVKKAVKNDPKRLKDFMVQDVFVLNIQRAAQACIDMANIVITQKNLELPRSYKNAFFILEKEKVISSGVALKMQKMAGFRNISIHEYQEINVDILKSIFKNHLNDFELFYSEIFVDQKNEKN